MPLTHSGMTLYADHDTQESWVGTDDLDAYNMSIQGLNSESWNVAKNGNETGTMSKTVALGTPKYFTCWMKSDLTNYYTSVSMSLSDGTNQTNFTCADTTNRDITGEFHPSVLQVNQGSNASYVPNNHTQFICNIDNSASGNIRSVINNWIDTMHYGNGRAIAGSTVGDKLFEESHILDTTTTDEYDGCSELFPSGLAYYTDITIDTTVGNSYGETVTFYGSRNTDDIFTIKITGTSYFKNAIIGNACKINIDATTATSFGSAGASLKNGGTVKFASGQTHDGYIFTSCNEIDTNGAILNNCTVSDTTEITTGSVIVNSDTEAGAMDNMQFKNYSNNSRYAVYVPASVTSFSMDNWQFDDPNNTSGFALYWGVLKVL